jgi:hypothetical protein
MSQQRREGKSEGVLVTVTNVTTKEGGKLRGYSGHGFKCHNKGARENQSIFWSRFIDAVS